MLPLLIAAGIGLVAGAAAGSGFTTTNHHSEHKHVHVHVHKGRGRTSGLARAEKSKQMTTNLYKFAKSNALPPSERDSVHKAISDTKE